MFFLLGSIVAWFLWTRIVRLNVFHVPIYQPPLTSMLIHTFAIIFGMMLGTMGAMFLGFVDAVPRDLYFKIVADALAFALMVVLAFKIRKR